MATSSYACQQVDVGGPSFPAGGRASGNGGLGDPRSYEIMPAQPRPHLGVIPAQTALGLLPRGFDWPTRAPPPCPGEQWAYSATHCGEKP